jgi:hypothetical protein
LFLGLILAGCKSLTPAQPHSPLTTVRLPPPPFWVHQNMLEFAQSAGVLPPAGEAKLATVASELVSHAYSGAISTAQLAFVHTLMQPAPPPP